MHELLWMLAPSLLGAVATARAWLRWRFRRSAAPVRVGSPAPDFGPLPGADGRSYGLEDFRAKKLLVLVFMANRCPGVKAYDERLVRMQRDFANRGVQIVGINPIDEHLYPTESLSLMGPSAQERGLNFPYLKDVDQSVAQGYGATCTPHVFVLDQKRRIRYSGRIDNAFLPSKATEHYLRAALDALVADKPVEKAETAPLGCAIDWVAGGTTLSAVALSGTPANSD